MRNRSTLFVALGLCLTACEPDWNLVSQNSPPTASIFSHHDGEELFAGTELTVVARPFNHDSVQRQVEASP